MKPENQTEVKRPERVYCGHCGDTYGMELEKFHKSIDWEFIIRMALQDDIMKNINVYGQAKHIAKAISQRLRGEG